MISNIGLITNFASQNEYESTASQIYLWALSRVNMQKLVQRSIIARRTPMPVKMIIAEFHVRDRIPCGMTTLCAINQFTVCQMLTRVFQGTFVYLRRKPTDNGLSHNIHQLVMSWNTNGWYATMVEPNFETKMQNAWQQEEDLRLMSNPEYVSEMIEEERERWADMQQTQRITHREDFGLISPVSFD
jgi:hypothetical protein